MSPIVYFIIILSISFTIYWFVVPERWRSIFLLLTSIYVLSLFSIKFTIYFFLNVIMVYVAGGYITKENKNKKLLLQLTLIWLIGSLCFFKYSHLLFDPLLKLGSRFFFTPGTTFKIVLPLGISYVVFRLIHYIVEIYKKTLPKHSFQDLALYTLYFPTFIAGPVDRFQRFQPQIIERKLLNLSELNYSLFRIILGVLKKFFISDKLLSPLIMPVLTSPQESSPAFLLLAIYGLAIRMYMDFSGYTDMAIGVSRLFGYKIMENFNNPFFKQNIALLWRNWHISVYNFIRDYFFFPFFGYRASQLKIYIGIFLTMIVFMLWHEGTLPFLILGIYHGLGLVVWQAFQEMKGKYNKIRKIVDNKYATPFSIFFTFSFWSFSLIFFFFDMNTISDILHKMLYSN